MRERIADALLTAVGALMILWVGAMAAGLILMVLP